MNLDTLKGDRLQFVAHIDWINYINDSGSTTINQTFISLEHIKQPIVWICGGVERSNYWPDLKDPVREKVEHIIQVMESNFEYQHVKLIEAFSGCVKSFTHTNSLLNAVAIARKLASKGWAVLYSPACEPEIKNLIEKTNLGDEFKKIVRSI